MIAKSRNSFASIKGMKCTSQHCYDKTMDAKMALCHKCFLNCANLWWIKLLSLVLTRNYLPNRPLLDPPVMGAGFPDSSPVSPLQAIWKQHLSSVAPRPVATGEFWGSGPNFLCPAKICCVHKNLFQTYNKDKSLVRLKRSLLPKTSKPGYGPSGTANLSSLSGTKMKRTNAYSIHSLLLCP